jgi:hypothetical protein
VLFFTGLQIVNDLLPYVFVKNKYNLDYLKCNFEQRTLATQIVPNIRFIYLYPTRYEDFGLLFDHTRFGYTLVRSFIKQQRKLLHLP